MGNEIVERERDRGTLTRDQKPIPNQRQQCLPPAVGYFVKYLCEIFWWRGPKQTMGGIAVEINTDRPGWLEWLWRVTD